MYFITTPPPLPHSDGFQQAVQFQAQTLTGSVVMKIFTGINQTDTSPAHRLRELSQMYFTHREVTWHTILLQVKSDILRAWYLEPTPPNPQVRSSAPPLSANRRCRLPRTAGTSCHKHQRALIKLVSQIQPLLCAPQPKALTWTWHLCGLLRPRIPCAADLDPFGCGRKCREDRSVCLWMCPSSCSPPTPCEESKHKIEAAGEGSPMRTSTPGTFFWTRNCWI